MFPYTAVPVAEPEQKFGAREISLDIIRADGDGLSESTQCVFEPIKPNKGLASSDEGAGVTRPQFQGLVEARQSFVVAAQFQQGIAAIVMRFEVVGLQRDCTVVTRESIQRSLQCAENAATVVKRGGIISP